jgi:quercetin dioxygenase-like cupin family protein
VRKGSGIVATEERKIVVTPAILVLFPLGENHEHGAAKDSEFSHISITIS